MKTIIIVNPAAGNGNAAKKWNKFKNTAAFPHELVMTQYAGHAEEAAARLREADEPVLVIGFGGDGTMREIVAGAAGAPNLIVGSVAAGSGNDFSRGFYSFKDAEAVELFLQEPASLEQDLGEFIDSELFRFVSSSGIGFDAEISALVNRSLAKKGLNKVGAGKLVYLLYVIRTLFRFKKFDLAVETDGNNQQFKDVWLATVSNQPYFGGGMKISPDSKTGDGLLELTIVSGISRLKLLLVFGTVFTGTHTRFKEVIQLSGSQFRLTTDRQVYRHIDGDYAGKSPKNEPIHYGISKSRWNAINNGKKEDVL
ncbi:diacylglycerol kinase family lipid kinase [Planococcus sp. APC 3906]|uniref:diacylglycerol/lipid kinase family protein n=1 Tax=Planococcus sp. APC 3906 TaxID=3035194 RepID=UPI0025B4DC27|nr:diacylglycerol kinase family protein [Planococcus sp. APC 3906]MDN3450546.1 diacylglycerol kinase family lipid kinase [Planococcus sp. APC 3906]